MTREELETIRLHAEDDGYPPHIVGDIEALLAHIDKLQAVADAAKAMSKRYEHWYEARGPSADSAEHNELMHCLAALEESGK